MAYACHEACVKRRPSVTNVQGMDNINLFSVITLLSFCLLAPAAILLEVRSPAALHCMRSCSLLIVLLLGQLVKLQKAMVTGLRRSLPTCFIASQGILGKTFPCCLTLQGVRFTPSAMRAAGILNTSEVMKHVLIAALCFHSYQQVGADLSCSLLWSPVSAARHDLKSVCSSTAIQ